MPEPVVVYRYAGGVLTPLPVEARTLDEATVQTGHGTYSVFRLYSGQRVLRLDHHLDRMRRSAAALGEPFPHTNADLRDVLRRAVAAAGIEMPRVRLTVPYDAPETVIAALEPFTPPPAELYAQGVRAGLAEAVREHAEAKDSRFIERRRQLIERQPGVYEVMLHDAQGAIREGTTSNFYAIIDGTLRTAGEGMLQGIARSILLEVAPRILPVEFVAPCVDELSRAAEAMLTSSSRGVVPVVEVGEIRIGTGRPGPLTTRLGEAYDRQVEAELEPI